MVKAKAAVYATTETGQDVNGQLAPLREWTERMGYESVAFAEEGGTGASRPALHRLIEAVRLGEVQVIAVSKLDHLGRSLSHLLQTLQEFQSHAVRLYVSDMAMDTATAEGSLFFSMVAAFSEFERGLIGERVRDGLAYARRHGTKSGRPVGRPPLDVDFMTICDALRGRVHERGAIAEAARRFGVSRPWIYKHIVPALASS